MLNKTLVQFTTLLIALSSLQTISGSPLPLKTARAAALEKRKEASESESEKAAEPTQITVWQRPKFKDKQFKTANSDLIFPNLGDMSLGYNNALGKIKGVTVLTTKMKGQDAPITATLKGLCKLQRLCDGARPSACVALEYTHRYQPSIDLFPVMLTHFASFTEKIIVDDDSYEEKVVIKGDGKKWQGRGTEVIPRADECKYDPNDTETLLAWSIPTSHRRDQLRDHRSREERGDLRASEWKQ